MSFILLLLSVAAVPLFYVGVMLYHLLSARTYFDKKEIGGILFICALLVAASLLLVFVFGRFPYIDAAKPYYNYVVYTTTQAAFCLFVWRKRLT